MSRDSFATYAATAPFEPQPIPHGYTCHMAAVYWAFKDLGDADGVAAAKVQALASFTCRGCKEKPGPGKFITHFSLEHEWYGRHFCQGAIALKTHTDLLAYAEVGDVILVGAPQRPMHSMIVVSTGTPGPIKIRGFNNYNTTGTGAYNKYDNGERDISDRNTMWHEQDGVTHLGQDFVRGGPAHRIPYERFVNVDAVAVRQNVKQAGGSYTYTGRS
jgi:hypothetical protein